MTTFEKCLYEKNGETCHIWHFLPDWNIKPEKYVLNNTTTVLNSYAPVYNAKLSDLGEGVN